jgi:23S rRNA pseudouridine1911/1915/1917 synthase
VSEPRVLHETDGWIVLEKPAGLHTVALKKDEAGESVEAWLRAQRPELVDLEEAGLVNRLDHGTSGCLLVGRSPEEQVRLRNGMRDGSILKTYHALIAGGVPETGRFKLYFTSRYKRSKKVTVGESGELRHMGTCAWRARGRGEGVLLLEVELRGAGRRHQLRAGLAHLGAPLFGDALYGGPSWEKDRPALHAWQLRIDGEAVESPSPLVAAVSPAAD